MRTDIVSFLVLDYKKPLETQACLESIRKHVKVPHQIIYLDNGSKDNYPWELYKQELADIIISRNNGLGGGCGQIDLFRFCDTKYAFFIQSDQILIQDIAINTLAYFIDVLDRGFKCVDLNRDQSQKGRWTDRAHFINVEWFNNLNIPVRGGPGPFHEERWVENYLQEVFDKLGNPIAHIEPLFFADRGIWTIRELPDGGIVKMRTDTKEIYWINNPTKPYIFPDLTDEEWSISISGKWINGTIPEKYKQHSFNCWGNIKN